MSRFTTSVLAASLTFVILLLAPQVAAAHMRLMPRQNGQTTYAWGDFGENGAVSPKVDTPSVVDGIPGTIAQVVATNSDTYLRLTNGQVWAFGANGDGELGQGDTSSYTMTPVQIPLPYITSLPSSMPYATGLAIDNNGHIWGWGSNDGGELCKGSVHEYTRPVRLPLSNVTLAAGAGAHASYLSNGTLDSCGQGDYGQLGDGSFSQSLSPASVNLEGVVALYSSYADTAALLSNGSFYDWGNNSEGQLGNNSSTSANSDVPVGVAQNVTAAAVGGNDWQDGQTFVTLSDGITEAWGADAYGQLCLGYEQQAVTNPVVVSPPKGVTWTTWTSGGSTSYPLDARGDLWVCGDNASGEAGLGYQGGPVTTPTEIPTNTLSNVTAVSSTSRNVAALSGG